MKKLFSTLLASLLLMGSFCPQYAVAATPPAVTPDEQTHKELRFTTNQQVQQLGDVLTTCSRELNGQNQPQVTQNIESLTSILQKVQTIAQEQLNYAALHGYLAFLQAATQTVQTAMYYKFVSQRRRFFSRNVSIEDQITELNNIQTALHDLKHVTDTPFTPDEFREQLQHNAHVISTLSRTARDIGLTFRKNAWRQVVRWGPDIFATATAAAGLYWLIRRSGTPAQPSAQVANAQIVTTPQQSQAIATPQPAPTFQHLAFSFFGGGLATLAARTLSKVMEPMYDAVAEIFTSRRARLTHYLTQPAQAQPTTVNTTSTPSSTSSATRSESSESDNEDSLEDDTTKEAKPETNNTIERTTLNAYIQPIIDFTLNPGRRKKSIHCALFAGPPGSGKTHFAHELRSLLTQKLREKYRPDHREVKLHEFPHTAYTDKFCGPQKTLEQVQSDSFANYETPCIVIIDEFEKLFETKEGRSVVAEFLSVLDGRDDVDDPDHPIIIIATANRPETLNPALLRAFRFYQPIWFANPNRAELAQLIETEFPTVGTENVMYVAQRMHGASFAELLLVLGNARSLADAKKSPIVTLDHIDESINSHMLRITHDVPYDDACKMRVAAHQAGHIVANHILGRSQQILDVVTINYIMPTTNEGSDSRAYGLTKFLPKSEDGACNDKWELTRRAFMAHAGRAAEDILCGSADIDYHCLKHDDTELNNCLTALAADYSCTVDNTPEDKHKLYDRIRGLLEQHRHLLERIQQVLIEHHTLTGRQLETIIQV